MYRFRLYILQELVTPIDLLQQLRFIKPSAVKRIICFSLFLTITMVSFNQEICDNGIDDDGDGLIDLQDVDDCLCKTVMEEAVVGDFELHSCCPTGITTDVTTPGEGINCLDDGWVAPNHGTTDYFHTCGYMGGTQFQGPPVPLPSGNGCIALYTSIVSNEHIAYCMSNCMIPGTTYSFGFYIAINPGPLPSPPNTTVHVLGTNDCNNIPDLSIIYCMTVDPEWYSITTVDVVNLVDSRWRLVQASFVATEPTTAIAVAIDCGVFFPSRSYYFFDSIYVHGDFNVQLPQTINITATGDCLSGITLSIPSVPGSTFQWYLNDIAIPGANSNIYIPNPIVNGAYQVAIYNGPDCELSLPYVLQVDFNAVPIDEIIEQITCFNDNNGSIDISPQSTNLPLDYEWSSGDFTEDLNNLSKGIYTVTVTDANGCFGIETYTIINPDPFSALLNVSQPVGVTLGSAEVIPTGGVPAYFYSWSNGDTTSVSNNLAPGLYMITVTDDLGCELVLDLEIYEALVVIESVVDESCYQSCDGEVTATASGGLPGYSIVWSFGGLAMTESFLCPGIYFYTLTDQFGTSVSDTVEVSAAVAYEITSTYNTPLCDSNSSAIIQVLIQGGNMPFDYLWSTGSTTDTVHVSNGTFSVTVNDLNNCELVEDFIIELSPSIELSSDIINDDCEPLPAGSINLIISGGVPPYDVLWNNGQETELIDTLFGGQYFVTVTDNANCIDTASFVVGSPSSFTLTSQIINVGCDGSPIGSIELTPTGGQSPFTYQWSRGDTTAAIFNAAPGQYRVTVTDINSCSQLRVFEIQGADSILLLASAFDASCFGIQDGGITLNVSGGIAPYQYIWNDGDTLPNRQDLAAGSYSVAVYDTRGCVDSASYEILSPDELLLNPIIQNAGCGGGTDGFIILQIIGGLTPYNIVWQDNSNDTTLNNLTSGSYIVTVSDINNCAVIDTIIIQEGTALSIVSEISQLQCAGDKNGQIIIHINGGSEPYLIEWGNSMSDTIINNLSVGNYIVTVTDDENCINIQSYTIDSVENLVLTPTISPPLCFNLSGSILLSIDNGTPPYEILWNTGETTNPIAVLAGTDYYVTITDANNCTINSTYTTAQLDSLYLTINNIQLPSSSNDDGLASINIIGGTTPYTILWNDTYVQTTVEADSLSFGNYIVIVTDANGCTATIEVVLSEDALNVLVNVENNVCFDACEGQISLDISGGLPPYQTNWSNGQSGSQQYNLCSGSYMITVSDADGNMFKSNPINISNPSAIFVEETIILSECPGELDAGISLMVSGGTPPYQYNWNTLATTASINNISDGIYQVTITDNLECISVYEYIIEAVSPIALIALVQPWDCGTSSYSIELMGDNPNNYPIFINGLAATVNTDNIITPIEAGTYQLAYQVDANCIIVFDTLTLDEKDKFSINLTSDTIWAQLNGAATIGANISSPTNSNSFITSWISNHPFTCIRKSVTGTCLEIELLINSNEAIDFKFEDADGCSFIKSIPVVLRPRTNIFIPNVFSPNNDGLNDVLTPYSNVDLNVKRFLIFDRWGNVVFERTNALLSEMEGWNGRRFDRALNEGVFVYLIEIVREDAQTNILSGDILLIR